VKGKMKLESEIFFLGTGTSEGVPRVSCLTVEDPTCKVCTTSIIPGNKNRRRNTGIIICYPHPDGRERVIMVDVGKFFWHAAMEWLTKYKIHVIDAIVITHDHFDAIGGLDDLRDFTRAKHGCIPIYLRQSDYNTINTMFPYLTRAAPITYSSLENKPLESKSNVTYTPLTARIVPDLAFIIFDEDLPFIVEGLEMTPLKVLHGGDYVCLGFRFGTNESVAYISDAHCIPDATRQQVVGVDVFILDCLYRNTNFSHFSVSQSIEEVRKIRPKKRTLFIGMSHDLDHDETNKELEPLLSEGLDVSLAYDGQCFSVSL